MTFGLKKQTGIGHSVLVKRGKSKITHELYKTGLYKKKIKDLIYNIY